MPKQMKGGSFKGRGAKAGTTVYKCTPRGLFMPRTQGISAHGQLRQVNAIESRDRREG